MSVTEMAKTAEPGAEEAKGGKKKLIIIVVVLLVVAGAGYWFFLKPSGPKKAPAPVAGVVVKLDPIQINLAANHYLKVGIALQATKSAGEELDGSKALDATIALFSGQKMERVTRPAAREKLKKQLEHTLAKQYEGDVMGVYFTDFVTQ